MEHTFKVTILVKVKTDLDVDEALEELTSDCYYDFPSTDNVEVVNTRWEETETL